AGCLFGQANGDRPAAELVDEAELAGVLAGPDPALGDLADALDREPAAVGDLGGEVDVDAVEPGLEALPAVSAVVVGVAEEVAVGGAGDGVVGDAEALEEVAGEQL